nr:hypothetical protein OG999_38620 [Streptomyces sp. NBC_00886]
MDVHGGLDIRIGHEVLAALRAAGLSADRDGDPDKTIDVKPPTWHKRLVERGAERQLHAKEASKQ